MKKIFFLILIVLGVNNPSLRSEQVFAQTKDSNKILNAVKQKFEKIHDYQADVNIHVDVNFIKMADKKAKIYFKQPDKVKFQSEGFAMLPKQGINFSPSQLLKGNSSAIFVRTEDVDGKKLDVIKVVPKSDSGDVVLSTVWVDEANSVINKVETIGKRSGNISMDFKYSTNQTLPDEVKFTFNFGGVQEQSNSRENDNNPAAMKQMGRGPLKGTATLTYTNYKINKGIPDSFFTEKKK